MTKKALRYIFHWDLWHAWHNFQEGRRYRRGTLSRPPHLLKAGVVLEHAERFSLRTFIETGTWIGLMVNATKRKFDRIYSIELDPRLAEVARRKFRKYPHVTIIQGDSAEILPSILPGLTQPALFWLDAHYSGGDTARGSSNTPILAELGLILSPSLSAAHVILVDDARDFTGADGYPHLDEVQQFIKKRRPRADFEVKDDIIRIYPQST